ncbi:hypothetical protein [Maridesulfovibrio sp.]|uniref:hypothetical protein n=1 Tax=Maridesulfovibrio sp. TaxID=2795000 RepID=UPI003B00BFA6
MPDRYGRFNMYDGLGFARGVLDFGEYQRRQEDRSQVERGLGMLGAGDTQKPEDISNQNWLRAQRGHTESQVLQKERDAIQFKNNVKQRINDYVPVLEQNGYNFDNLSVNNSVDVAASAELAKIYGDTEKGKNIIHKNRGENLARQYTTFNAGRAQVRQFLAEGNKDKAVVGIMELSKLLPMPYNLDQHDAETDSFSVKYLESKSGPQEVNRVSFNDVMTTINNVSEKRFFQQGALHSEAVRKSNLEYRTNPAKHLLAKNKDGQSVTIVPQKNIHNLSDVDYLVYSAGRDPYTLKSMGELKKQGFVFESLETDKKRADIAHTKAQTGKLYVDANKSRASTGKIQAETEKINAETANLPNKQAAEQLVQMRKSLGDALKPFHQKGKTLIDFTTGELTDEGNNAFNDASKLVESYNSGQWKPETEADKTRLQAAGQAVGIYQQIIQRGSGHIPDEDPEQRKQVDEIKTLIQQYGVEGAKRILNKQKDIRTVPTRPGVSSSRYGG